MVRGLPGGAIPASSRQRRAPHSAAGAWHVVLGAQSHGVAAASAAAGRARPALPK